MTAYIVRRLLLIIPTIIMASMLVFLTVRLIPGDIVEMMMMEHKQTLAGTQSQQLNIERIKERLGLNRPIHIQYVEWVKGLLRGDFGKSLWTDRDVLDDILQRIPVSAQLGLMAMVIANLLGVSIGAYAAFRQDSVFDYIARGFAIVFLSVPGFWLATMAIVFPSLWWGWTPPIEYTPFTKDPVENLKQFSIPAVLLGLAMSGWVVRFLRTTMLDVMRQDYVRTAWAKGLRERVVVGRHVMRNALIPVVTIIAGQLGLVIGGTVIIEQIFSLPGMGRLFVKSAFARDYPYVIGINMLAGTFTLFVILVTDLSYAYLDPRIRYK